MNKSIKKYLLLLIAVFMVGESRVSASDYLLGLAFLAHHAYFELKQKVTGRRDPNYFGYNDPRSGGCYSVGKDSIFELVRDGRFKELKAVWSEMTKDERCALFWELKSCEDLQYPMDYPAKCFGGGNIFHFAASTGRFDILTWLIKELYPVFEGTTYEYRRSQENYYSPNFQSFLHYDKKWSNGRFVSSNIPESVLYYLYPWHHKCQSEKEFKAYKECLQFVYDHDSYFSKGKHIAKIHSELPDLHLQKHSKTIIKYILSRVDQIRAQRITANRVQMFKRFAGAFILCAFAYKIKAYQRVKSLIAGGFNFIGHRAFVAGQALSH